MKPDAIYYFSRISEYQTRYKQISHKGKIVPCFPSVYKSGKHKGEKYVVFRRTSDYYNRGELQFSHALELAKNQIVTKLIFLPEYPQQSYGAYNEYGLLIEFSDNFDKLAIWFFKGLQEAAPILFQRRQAREIPEITRNETIKLKYGIESSAL
jgi:hypothetical protein